MTSHVSEKCQSCIAMLKAIVSTLSAPDRKTLCISHDQVNEELERLCLWVGNIGALHRPESTLSLETRLREADDIFSHIIQLLGDLNDVVKELFEIVSGQREGHSDPVIRQVEQSPLDDREGDADKIETEVLNEERELLEEIGACISRLTRVSGLIRQAAPSDLFQKALSRDRYQFNDQFDIAHVGQKFPKLAMESAWLQKRLGRAITHRRHYLRYIRDHRNKLLSVSIQVEPQKLAVEDSQAHVTKNFQNSRVLLNPPSHLSTFSTKASSLNPGRITTQMLAAEEEADVDNDARSYTTIARSVDVDPDSARIPKLEDLLKGSRKDFECPFCFRLQNFKNERVWRRHVFADLRAYVCTFPDCDTPYFGDINFWFQHELQFHRVSYSCRWCEHKIFYLKERYLDHIKRQHPDLLDGSDEKPLFDIAREPLDLIPARDCPCCSEWVTRLQDRVVAQGLSTQMSDNVPAVLPSDFKRHLASHLEQLTLFAIPVGSSSNEDIASNVAIDEDQARLSMGHQPAPNTTLTFHSPRQSLTSNDFHVNDLFLEKTSSQPALERAPDSDTNMNQPLNNKKTNNNNNNNNRSQSFQDGDPQTDEQVPIHLERNLDALRETLPNLVDGHEVKKELKSAKHIKSVTDSSDGSSDFTDVIANDKVAEMTFSFPPLQMHSFQREYMEELSRRHNAVLTFPDGLPNLPSLHNDNAKVNVMIRGPSKDADNAFRALVMHVEVEMALRRNLGGSSTIL